MLSTWILCLIHWTDYLHIAVWKPRNWPSPSPKACKPTSISPPTKSKPIQVSYPIPRSNSRPAITQTKAIATSSRSSGISSMPAVLSCSPPNRCCSSGVLGRLMSCSLMRVGFSVWLLLSLDSVWIALMSIDMRLWRLRVRLVTIMRGRRSRSRTLPSLSIWSIRFLTGWRLFSAMRSNGKIARKWTRSGKSPLNCWMYHLYWRSCCTSSISSSTSSRISRR